MEVSSAEKVAGRFINENPPPLPPRPFWHSKSLGLMALVALAGIFFWLRRIHAASGADDHHLGDSAMFRFDASFTGGFFIGWAYRKSIRIATMILAGLLALFGAAKWTGLLPFDWDMITQSLHDAFAFFSGEAAKAKKNLTGVLPSGLAGGLGVFKGARHK